MLRLMTRITLVVFGFGFGFAVAHAAAQTDAGTATAGTITYTFDISGRADSVSNSTSAQPVSQAECDANVDLLFDFKSVPSSATLLDVWEGSGADCSTTDQRGANGSCTHRTLTVDTAINGQTEVVVTIPIKDLVDCSSSEDQDYSIYVLAASSSASQEDVGTSYAFVPISVDTAEPDAPSSLTASDGESSVAISWTAPTGLNHQELYVDTNPGDSCANTSLVSGSALPTGLTATDSAMASTQNSASVDVTSLAIGAYIAVAVIAVDDATNPSVVSVDCAQRVNTQGFCDALAIDGGSGNTKGCPNSCSISDLRRSDLPGAFAEGAGVFLCAAFLIARRRRSSL